MTFRATEKDLEGQLERLYRNLGIKQFEDKPQIVHANGYINLMSNRGSHDLSLGNTKTELYWQLVLVNKILEMKIEK